MLNQIIMLHPAEFTCKAVAKFLQNQGVKSYYINKNEELAYLVDDLRPEVILVHHSMLDFCLAELNDCEFRAYSLVQIHPELDEENCIKEPFDPSEIYARLSDILATDHKSS